eukprot:14349646-Alexandrium_andersonii.AAC.1
MAQVLHPLVLNVMVHGYEPFAWRGSQAFQVAKQAPDPSECSAHRAVVLADALSKVLHGLGRLSAFGTYE